MSDYNGEQEQFDALNAEGEAREREICNSRAEYEASTPPSAPEPPAPEAEKPKDMDASEMTVMELIHTSDIRDSCTGKHVEDCYCAECREFMARLRAYDAVVKEVDTWNGVGGQMFQRMIRGVIVSARSSGTGGEGK
jgi:hypothetical protein